jgi:hypothetical protein
MFSAKKLKRESQSISAILVSSLASLFFLLGVGGLSDYWRSMSIIGGSLISVFLSEVFGRLELFSNLTFRLNLAA